LLRGLWALIIGLTAAACMLRTGGEAWPFDAGEDGTVEDEDLDAPFDYEVDRSETPCTSIGDCNDYEPCNGQETCEDGWCVYGPPLEDGSECIAPSGLPGTCERELCIPLSCGDSVVDPGEECDDGNDTGGDGCERNCNWSCREHAECDDANPCTLDTCEAEGSGRLCRNVPREMDCDDGDPCTHTDVCGPDGICSGRPYVCDIGPCIVSSECDGEGGCAVTTLPEGTACDDGASCTPETTCDGAGACRGFLDDGLCGTGELCRPQCFEGTTGCGIPPASLDLQCRNPVSPSSRSWCELTAGGLSSQVPCLHCSAEIGRLVALFDFGDDRGSCDMDGWDIVSGSSCFSAYEPGCVPSGEPVECCDDGPATICTDLGGDFVLRSDKRENCGGDHEEWQIRKQINALGVTSLKLCLSVGKKGAITAAEWLIIRVSDEGHNEVLVCLNGDDIINDFLFGESIDDTLYPACFDLPGWAANNENVTITIIAHSESDGKAVFIDDAAIKGESGGCSISRTIVFREDFTGCAGVMTDGWHGWTVNGTINCPGFACTGGSGDGIGIAANGVSWVIEHALDTSTIDGEVMLCFDLGENNADGGESVSAEFSTDGGHTWHRAWYQEKNMTPNMECRNICVDLSSIEPSIRRNPDARIRFSLTADNRIVVIDAIEVSGAEYCDGSALVGVSPVSEDTPGHYELGVSTPGSDQLSVLLTCGWDEPPLPVESTAEIMFIH
jgi:cysteine-rich repeat protein